MADHERDAPREPRRSGDPPGPAVPDLAAALAALDRATRDFTSRLGEGQREIERARLDGEQAISEASSAALPRAGSAAVPAAIPPSADRAAVAPLDPRAGVDPDAALDRHMRRAEVEARSYLEAAKRRADSLVDSMVEAIEREAVQARREAEEGIRARWQQVEAEADRHVENARLVAARMVAERQARIAALSDGISDRAEALTAGMDDAAQVRAQFDAFVRALSAAADRIARQATGTEAEPNGGLRQPTTMVA